MRVLKLLAGCMAPADRMEASKLLVLHMIKSAKSDPQWVRTEQSYIDAATRNINIITALTGTATMTDPSGKAYYNVPVTQGYLWVRNGQPSGGVGGEREQQSHPQQSGAVEFAP
jgi:hypothetical protein